MAEDSTRPTRSSRPGNPPGARRRPPPELNVGTRVAGYVVETRLGAGGYGTVYRARSGRSVVALKLLPLETSEGWEEREVDVLRRLKHPHVVRLLGYVDWPEEDPFYRVLLMENVDGVPVDEWARHTNPSALEVVELILPLLEALGAVHAAGVVHRDVKMSNILVRASDGRPVLVDFGAGAYPGAPTLTSSGLPPGTAEYRSPETWDFFRRHVGEDGARYLPKPSDDLWAVGIQLYWLLTDRLPFTGGDFLAVGTAVLNKTPEPPSQHNPLAPEELGRVCLRMLEKSPGARYANADELCAALTELKAKADESWRTPLFEPNAPHNVTTRPQGQLAQGQDLPMRMARLARQYRRRGAAPPREETPEPEDAPMPEQPPAPEQTATPEQPLAPEQRLAPEQLLVPEQTATPELPLVPEQAPAPKQTATPEQTPATEGSPPGLESSPPARSATRLSWHLPALVLGCLALAPVLWPHLSRIRATPSKVVRPTLPPMSPKPLPIHWDTFVQDVASALKQPDVDGDVALNGKTPSAPVINARHSEEDMRVKKTPKKNSPSTETEKAPPKDKRSRCLGLVGMAAITAGCTPPSLVQKAFMEYHDRETGEQKEAVALVLECKPEWAENMKKKGIPVGSVHDNPFHEIINRTTMKQEQAEVDLDQTSIELQTQWGSLPPRGFFGGASVVIGNRIYTRFHDFGHPNPKVPTWDSLCVEVWHNGEPGAPYLGVDPKRPRTGVLSVPNIQLKAVDQFH